MSFSGSREQWVDAYAAIGDAVQKTVGTPERIVIKDDEVVISLKKPKPESTGFNFELALLSMREGKHVARKVWIEDTIVIYEGAIHYGHMMRLTNPTGLRVTASEWNPQMMDILACDWMVVEGSPAS